MLRIIDFGEAIQLLQQGKTLQLIDNGDGYLLPGTVTMLPQAIAQTISDMFLGPNHPQVAVQVLLVNVIQNGEHGELAMRFYNLSQISQNSKWLYNDGQPDMQSEQSKTAHSAESDEVQQAMREFGLSMADLDKLPKA